MGYRVEREDPRGVGAELQSLLEETRDTPTHPGRIEWLYTKNPFGDAIVWVLRDPSCRFAGFTAALPRTFSVNGRSRRGWIGADFSIAPAHRTLGPAIQLRRAAREAIDGDQADLLVSFPNRRMRSSKDPPVAARAGAGTCAGN